MTDLRPAEQFPPAQRGYWPSVRVIIPSVLVVVAALSTVIGLEYNAGIAFRAVEARGVEDLTRAMTRLQNTLEFLVQRQEVERVRSELAALGAQADIAVALLVDDEDLVLASLRLADIGKPLAEIRATAPGAAEDIRRAIELARLRRAGTVTLRPAGNAVVGVYPITLGAKPGDLRPRRTGILLVQQDLTGERALQRHQVEQQAVQFGGFMVLMAGLVWIVLHFGVTRRAIRLVDAVGHLAEGDLSTRTGLAGNDEFARLGAAFDDMATRLETQQRQLGEEEQRLSLALEASGQGLWDLNVVDGTAYFSPEFAAMLGFDAAEARLGLNAWREQIHPEDRDATVQAVTDYLTGASPNNHVEYRMRNQSGAWVWIHSSGQVVERNAAGQPVRMVGTSIDISARKASENLLRGDREQQTVLREVLEDVVRGGSVADTLGHCLKRVLAVSWLSLQHRGGIFLLAEDDQSLHLTVAQDLEPEILAQCQRVPLGRCHCGRAAASGEIQISLHVDENHEITYPGMVDHGHYNLPLVSEGKVLGVMTLYLPPEFQRDPFKEEFLASVTDILAGYLRRKRAEEDLRRLNEELEGRVGQRTTQLLAAKEEAERANLSKSEFLSRMSHELRTPLNAILGFGQLLTRQVREAEAADNLREIMVAGQHLLDLINEVLDLARIESGKFTVSKEPLPLSPLIGDCLALIRPQAEGRGIRIVDAGQDCDASVLADRTRLKQVLLNLLSNAVKYNRPEGSISVACLSQGESLQIRISDTGPGLTPEQQARLFVAFERLNADQSVVEGTGIGLALSKRLVELMDGEIGVDSTPGSGSTFWVRLPVAVGGALMATPDRASAAATAQHPAGLRQWQVLCIEDNPANLRLVERILGRRQDIRLLSAIAPGPGLELARTQRPDLILLDINLPDMDGYAVLQCLREDAITRDIPVVAVSANAMPADLARGKAAGFTDYLTKPLDIDKLTATVYGILERGNFNGAHRDE